MGKYDYSKLQNGSDIRGVALPGVDGELVNLDKEAAERLGRAFLFRLTATTGKKPQEITIAIGMDPRISGPDLCESFCKGVLMHGATILNAGLASTPAMFMSTKFSEYNADGAVMITASHLPFNRNGFKFFDENGGLDKADITDIITFAESDSILNSMYPVPPKEEQKIQLMDRYAAHLRQLIIEGITDGKLEFNPQDAADTKDGLYPEGLKILAGMKITVDAGNGSGGFYAEKVLKPLGADVSSSQFLEPDGNFPNHAPNPEDKKAMASISNKVKEAGTHLGLIFDTDVDRASAVDENGNEINRNGIVALAAALIADKNPGSTVVTDSITSVQLTDFLENKLKLKHLRFKRGYRNVINKAIELNDEGIQSELAIETSGHAAYKENYFLDDGAYLATKIVIKAAKLMKEGKFISSVIADMENPAEAEEVRFPVKVKDFANYADQVLEKIEECGKNGTFPNAHIVEPNYEGVRISFDDPEISGWILIRKSLHDPIMPLNLEASTPGGIALMKNILRPVLKDFEMLDTTAL